MIAIVIVIRDTPYSRTETRFDYPSYRGCLRDVNPYLTPLEKQTEWTPEECIDHCKSSTAPLALIKVQ